MGEPNDDLDDVDARLYLIGPDNLPAESVIKTLSAVLAVIEPVAFLLPPKVGREGTAARDLRHLCAENNTAFIVQDDLELAESLAADGVHQSAPETIRDARSALGKDRILGAEIGRSRHDAMTAGEDGADYIAFGHRNEPVDQEIVDLIGWWREIFILPCLSFAQTPDDAAKLVKAGADFIGVSDTIWNDPDDPISGALSMQAAIKKG